MAKRPRNPRRDDAQPYGPPGDIRDQILNMILMGNMPNPMGPGDQDPYNENPNLPPASVEDDPNSYWDAQHMGNGHGQSFVRGPAIPRGQPGWDTPAGDGRYMPADPVGNGPQSQIIAALLASMGVK
jgi:hypothetical protein